MRKIIPVDVLLLSDLLIIIYRGGRGCDASREREGVGGTRGGGIEVLDAGSVSQED